MRNFEIGSRHPHHAHLGGQFAICEQELPAICQCAKFEKHSFIRDEDMAQFPSTD